MANNRSATALASELKNKPQIKEAIAQSLSKLNITPEKILSKLDEILTANQNPQATLNASKYLFELMGYKKELEEGRQGNIIINIDKGIVPLNLQTNDKRIEPTNTD